MNHKPVLLLDMDGVFVDFVSSFYEILERKHLHARAWFPDPNELKEHYISDNLIDERGADIETLICLDHDIFSLAKPFPGAVEGMMRLQERCEQEGAVAFICTAPHVENKPCYTHKAEWIENHLGRDWLKRTIITRDKTLVRGNMLLDDKEPPMGDFSPEWSHVLFSRSYNLHVVKPKIADWSEASIDYLLQVATDNMDGYGKNGFLLKSNRIKLS